LRIDKVRNGSFGCRFFLRGDHPEQGFTTGRYERAATATAPMSEPSSSRTFPKSTAIMPDYSLSSHVAPLGIAFYSGDGMPAHYRGGAFIGEHGSWDRAPYNGYKVVYVPFANGRPSGMAEDVVTGFLRGSTAYGRPVGLAVDKRGGLLIADDLGSTVWRVSAR
jgi:glucose/arabinose dehydrogenase